MILKKNNFKPLAKFPGGSKPWRCLHKPCKNIVLLNINYLKYGGKGCNVCAGLAPISEAVALKLFKSRGFTPLTKFSGAKVAWKSKHNVCGRVVTTSYESIRSGRG
jgi:hypothetical protein